MRSFTLISLLLLCSHSWIWVSGSGSHTVEVQPGEDVTLMCSNIYKDPTQTDWFRVVNTTKPSCVSSTYGSNGTAFYCEGFQNGKYEMSANITTVSLKIKRVDLSDCGLYFCGFYIDKHTVLGDATKLTIQGGCESNDEVDFNTEKEPDKIDWVKTILCALTAVLTVVVIVLAVQIWRLQTAVDQEPRPVRNKNKSADELNYAALSFQTEGKRSRRPPSDRELEPSVVYAATR